MNHGEPCSVGASGGNQQTTRDQAGPVGLFHCRMPPVARLVAGQAAQSARQEVAQLRRVRFIGNGARLARLWGVPPLWRPLCPGHGCVPESGNCSTGHTQRDAGHLPLAGQQGRLATPLQEGWPLSGGQRSPSAEAARCACRPTAVWTPPVAEHKSTHALCEHGNVPVTKSLLPLSAVSSLPHASLARLLLPSFSRPGLSCTADHSPTSTTHPSPCRFS